MVPSFAFNAVLPSILFAVLSARGVPTIHALLVTAVLPLAWITISWARARHLDGIGLVSVIVIAIGVLVALISGDPRLYLVKDSFLTGGFAAICLASLALPRPLVYHLWGHFASAGDADARTRWTARWRDPAFRRAMRLMTLVWGLAFGADAIFRVPLALLAPPSLVLLVNPLVTLGIVTGLAVWMTRLWRSLAHNPAQAG
jgi:hypothetical protein